MAQEGIMQAIEIIDKRIKTLMNLRQGLVDEFQISSGTEATPLLPFKSHKIRIKRKPTNREVIIKYLQEQGPQSRGEIVKGTSIPAGSVAGIMTDKETFYSKDEKWHLVEDKQK